MQSDEIHQRFLRIKIELNVDFLSQITIRTFLFWYPTYVTIKICCDLVVLRTKGLLDWKRPVLRTLIMAMNHF